MTTLPDHPPRPATSARRTSEAPAPTAIEGPLLRGLFRDALELLHQHIQPLNALNVYPVPDGDTGTNMHLTLQAGVQEMNRAAQDDLPTVARALAHGALMGARGNSGVILSQVLRGLASALAGERAAGGRALARGLAQAKEAAYAALSEPVEGTMLTVIREAAEALAREPPGAAAEALDRAAAAAFAAVERTPELLSVLKEAGVVDAGGLGLAIILEGLRRSLRGEPLDMDLAPEAALEAGWRSEATSLHGAEHGESGYCTEFLVAGAGADPAQVRSQLAALGTSLLVVSQGDLLRVHLHTARPDDAIAYGRSLGQLSQVKVDNLEAQIQRFFGEETPSAPVTASIDVVTVAAGEGMAAAFRSVGVTHVVEGGQTMNPSAGELLAAIEACAADQVIVLPNNQNIIATAKQAAAQASKLVAVVPSRAVPQGIAAVLALSPDLSFEANVEAMTRALDSVRWAEVTRAVRDMVIERRPVATGQAIGIVDGKLRVVADTVDAAVQECVAAMQVPEASLLTLYIGREACDEDAEALAEALRARYPDLEVDLVRGEQPHYPYILSLE